MAIQWVPFRKKRCIELILATYPADSSKCEEAAHHILPLARHQDAEAQYWLLRPQPALGPMAIVEEEFIRQGKIQIVPTNGGISWTYHVCVETDRHCVCALTGVKGTHHSRYISKHFQYGKDAVRRIKIKHPEDLDKDILKISADMRRQP